MICNKRPGNPTENRLSVKKKTHWQKSTVGFCGSCKCCPNYSICNMP